MAAERETLHVGFLGGGNMATALAKGFIASQMVLPENIIVSALTEKTLSKWKDMGCKTTTNSTEVVSGCKILFICVKPYIVPEVMPNVSHAITEQHLVISVVAGLTISLFENQYKCHRVIRTMPNLPSAVQQGCIGFSCGTHATKHDTSLVNQLFSTLGFAAEVKEPLLDVVCGLAGSGAGFIYLVIEAMSDGAVKAGLPRALAYKFATQAVLGAAALVKETGKLPAQLKDETCSPGGTTISGIHQLEKAGVRSAFIDAVETATNKAREYSKQ